MTSSTGERETLTTTGKGKEKKMGGSRSSKRGRGSIVDAMKRHKRPEKVGGKGKTANKLIEKGRNSNKGRETLRQGKVSRKENGTAPSTLEFLNGGYTKTVSSGENPR